MLKVWQVRKQQQAQKQAESMEQITETPIDGHSLRHPADPMSALIHMIDVQPHGQPEEDAEWDDAVESPVLDPGAATHVDKDEHVGDEKEEDDEAAETQQDVVQRLLVAWLEGEILLWDNSTF